MSSAGAGRRSRNLDSFNPDDRIAADFLSHLARVISDDAIDTRDEEREFFAEDSLGRRGHGEALKPPIAVVRPATSEAVAETLALCSKHDIPVVPYGAGTGLMGGARSVRQGIVLDTNRLKSIDLHADDRFVWAGAGVILQDLDDELKPHGLCIGHDPWTFPVATVGGALSTNGLGYKGGRYGSMGDQAIALEVALTDGTLLRTRAVSKSSAGPRFERVFIGAEGTLGVITAAALRAHAVPEARDVRAYRFDRFEDGFRVIDAMAALGLRPSLLDYGEEHASPWPHLASREEEPPILYLAFEGLMEEVEASLERAEALITAGSGVAEVETIAQHFWESRHVIAERFSRSRRRDSRPDRSPELVFDYIHVALPASNVLEFRLRCHAETAASGVALLECGLWTGPELFSAVFAMPVALGGREKVARVIDTLLMAAQDLGGSMEYVHGAGLRYAHLMERELGAGFNVLRALKTALDPKGILNPGKLGL